MPLFHEAKNESPHLKALIYGGPGTGKTYTTALVGVGLGREVDGSAPAYWLDTGEQGVDHVTRLFDEAKVPLRVLRADTVDYARAAVKEAREAGAYLFVLDQSTRLYHNTLTRWRRGRVEIPGSERDAIRDEMAELHADMKDLDAHTIVVARGKDDWQDQLTEDGRKESARVGVKLDGDGAGGFEAAITIQMERVRFTRDVSPEARALMFPCSFCGVMAGARCRRVAMSDEVEEGDEPLRARPHADRIKAQADVIHYRRALVEKDRTGALDGRVLVQPTFRAFAPVLAALSKASSHVVLDVRPALKAPDEVVESRARAVIGQRKEIALGWLKDTLAVADVSARSKGGKEKRTSMLWRVFNTPVMAEIELLDAERIEEGVDHMRRELQLPPRTRPERNGDPKALEALKSFDFAIGTTPTA